MQRELKNISKVSNIPSNNKDASQSPKQIVESMSYSIVKHNF